MDFEFRSEEGRKDGKAVSERDSGGAALILEIAGGGLEAAIGISAAATACFFRSGASERTERRGAGT